MNGQEQQYKDQLEWARHENTAKKIKTVSGTVRDIASKRKEIKKRMSKVISAMSLSNYIRPFDDWVFGIALSFAILKDISDLTGLGSLPVIGTIITFFVSAIIFFSLLIAGSGSKKNLAKNLVKKYGTLAIGTLVEFIFGIDFLPIETCVVILTFFFVLRERQETAEEQALENSTQQENYA